MIEILKSATRCGCSNLILVEIRNARAMNTTWQMNDAPAATLISRAENAA